MSQPALDPFATLRGRWGGAPVAPPVPAVPTKAGHGGTPDTPVGSHCGGVPTASALLVAALAGSDALAAGYGDGEHDRAERTCLAEHYAAEPAQQPYRPDDPDPLRDGLLRAALARPPTWADVEARPPPGAWCACCVRHRPDADGRWWRGARNPTGRRCVACNSAPCGVRTVETQT